MFFRALSPHHKVPQPGQRFRSLSLERRSVGLRILQEDAEQNCLAMTCCAPLPSRRGLLILPEQLLRAHLDTNLGLSLSLCADRLTRT